MIKMLKEKGYRVQTNTTIFRETTAEEIEELVKYARPASASTGCCSRPAITTRC